MPAVIAHADWGSEARKRWLAQATIDASGIYHIEGPTRVDAPRTLLGRLFANANRAGAALVGFDFPIGVPARYAELAGIESFSRMLPRLGEGEWSDFYRACDASTEISIYRPFYPNRTGPKDTQFQSQLYGALGLPSMDGLLRICERATAERRAACSLFWTLGGNQVGKAAISGWSEVLAPAIRARMPIALWPFDGTLEALLEEPQVVVVETYPTEFYGHLGLMLKGSKRDQSTRRRITPALRAWLAQEGVASRVRLEPSAEEAIASAFGERKSGEDPFDAFIGLIGMLNIILARRSPGEPPDGSPQRAVEGWILGQQAATDAVTLF